MLRAFREAYGEGALTEDEQQRIFFNDLLFEHEESLSRESREYLDDVEHASSAKKRLLDVMQTVAAEENTTDWWILVTHDGLVGHLVHQGGARESCYARRFCIFHANKSSRRTCRSNAGA